MRFIQKEPLMIAHQLSRRERILEKPQRPILKLWALINISICIEFQDNRAFGLTWVDSRSTLDDHHRPRSY